MKPAIIHEMETCPNLAWNAIGTRLNSTNETDRAGDDKQEAVSAFAIDHKNGRLTLLNTISSGAGLTNASFYPSGRHLLVANSFGVSVAAACRCSPTGSLGPATDVKTDAGKFGSTQATGFAGELRDQRRRSDARLHDRGRPRWPIRAAVDLGLDKNFVSRFDLVSASPTTPARSRPPSTAPSRSASRATRRPRRPVASWASVWRSGSPYSATAGRRSTL